MIYLPFSLTISNDTEKIIKIVKIIPKFLMNLIEEDKSRTNIKNIETGVRPACSCSKSHSDKKIPNFLSKLSFNK